MYWRVLWEFVKRHSLAIVIVAVLAIAAWPWTLIVIIPGLFIVIGLLATIWKMRRNFQNMHQHMHQQQEPRSNSRAKNKTEGKVTIVQTEQAEQRVNDDVGEYVDFKEVKEKETK